VKVNRERKDNMRKNIVLIGMPGSGKSTVGVVLAKRLGYHFLDVDLVIQNQQRKLLWQIIQEHGNTEFLQIESKVNEEIDVQNTVIAPGGSVVLEPEAMKHLKEIAIVVYLKIEYKELKRRLGDLSTRGVVLEEGKTLKDLYSLRSVLCEKYADIIIEEKELSLYETTDIVLKKVTSILKSEK